MTAVTVIYVLVQITVVGVLPHAAASSAPIGAALGVLLGPIGITLGSIAVLLSAYGWLTGFALMSPRIIFAMMAERGGLPRLMAHVNQRGRVPDARDHHQFGDRARPLAGLAGDFRTTRHFRRDRQTRDLFHSLRCADRSPAPERSARVVTARRLVRCQPSAESASA